MKFIYCLIFISLLFLQSQAVDNERRKHHRHLQKKSSNQTSDQDSNQPSSQSDPSEQLPDDVEPEDDPEKQGLFDHEKKDRLPSEHKSIISDIESMLAPMIENIQKVHKKSSDVQKQKPKHKIIAKNTQKMDQSIYKLNMISYTLKHGKYEWSTEQLQDLKSKIQKVKDDNMDKITEACTKVSSYLDNPTDGDDAEFPDEEANQPDDLDEDENNSDQTPKKYRLEKTTKYKLKLKTKCWFVCSIFHAVSHAWHAVKTAAKVGWTAVKGVYHFAKKVVTTGKILGTKVNEPCMTALGCKSPLHCATFPTFKCVPNSWNSIFKGIMRCGPRALIAPIKSLFKSNPSKILHANSVEEGLCQSLHQIVSANMECAVKALNGKFYKALTFGFSGDVSAGDSISGEIGIGLDKNLKKFCYSGTCRGIKTDVGAGFGMTLSLWNDYNSVPGPSWVYSAGVSIPGTEIGVNYADNWERNKGTYLGTSYSMGIAGVSISPLDLEAYECNTPSPLILSRRRLRKCMKKKGHKK